MFTKILKQRSFRSFKKLLLRSVFVFFWLFLISPNAGNIASATNNDKSVDEVQQKNLIERNTILDIVSKAAYIIVWPLVTIAGIAMDNQMVYGSFMYLDAPLRKLWNLIKNLGNFALGFLFLAWILWYVISPWGIGKIKAFKNTFNSPADLIKKTLIAGVLIQMSWFIMMVLVDLSTILTYSVGALPSSVLSKITTDNDSKVMTTNVIVDLWDAQKWWTQAENESLKFYSTLAKVGGKGEMHIAPCEIFSWSRGAYVIERKYNLLRDPHKKGLIDMEDGFCTYNGALVAFSPYSISSQDKTITSKDGFLSRVTLIKKVLAQATEEELKKLEDIGVIVPLYKPSIVSALTSEQEVEIKDTKIIAGVIPSEATPGFISSRKECSNEQCSEKEYKYPYSEYWLEASKIMEKANSRTGPFVTLYNGLMAYSTSIDFSKHGMSQKLLVLVLNTGFAVLLILPLSALVVVLLRRVIVLWVAIAVSPLIVLKTVFWGLFWKWIDGVDFFDLEEIIKLLFAPVLVGFCVGISMIFMSALKTTLPTNGMIEQWMEQRYRDSFKQATGIEITSNEGGDSQELNILWFIKIKASIALVNFWWLIIMIFGMAITRFLLFAAIKWTKIGEKVWWKLQELWESLLATTPIIPTSSGGIGFWAIVNKPQQLLDSKMSELSKSRNSQLTWLLEPNSDAAKENRKKYNAENFINSEVISYVADEDNKIERLNELQWIYDAHEKYTYSTDDIRNQRLNVLKTEYSTLISQALATANVEQALSLANSPRVSDLYTWTREELINNMSQEVKKAIEFKDGKYQKKQVNSQNWSENNN